MLPHLESFVEVARLRSVSQAADALFITQPALTARLQQLERQLEAPLFVRTRQGMLLTDAGRAFLPYAQHALDTVAEGRRIFTSTVNGEAGELALAATTAVSTYVIPGLLSAFVRNRPSVRVTVNTAPTEEILNLVLADEVQLGISRATTHADVETIPLWADELMLVVSPGHEFASRDAVGLDEIADSRLVIDPTCNYDEVKSVFRDAEVALRGVVELDNIEAAKRTVAQGLGVAFLPCSVITTELEAGSLLPMSIMGIGPIWRHVVALKRPEVDSPLADAFLAELQESTAAQFGSADNASYNPQTVVLCDMKAKHNGVNGSNGNGAKPAVPERAKLAP